MKMGHENNGECGELESVGGRREIREVTRK
jgi:hypothetical protein